MDLVIRNATVIDGSRAPRFQADMAAKGIDTVIVNGKPVWRDGKPTGERPGKVLERSGRGE